jgi:hypothetical protein
MSHADLVNDVLFWLIVLSALLLIACIAAVIRTPPYVLTSTPAGPAPDAAGPAMPGPQTAAAAALPIRDAGASDYVARHASAGRPPWGPAPKPPGVDG